MAGPKFLRPMTAPDVDKGQAAEFGPESALTLDSGRTLAPWTIAYMTYGTLNEARSNAVPAASSWRRGGTKCSPPWSPRATHG